MLREDLSILADDGLYYTSAFRIARTPAYWDSQAVLAQIIGILLEEKFGFNVEYVPCWDETTCTFGTCGCSSYNDNDCVPVWTQEDAFAAVAEGTKVYPDPLSDIFLFTESYTEYVAREKFEATSMDYDDNPLNILGPMGYTSRDGLFIFPDLYETAWETYGLDLESFRSFGYSHIRNMTSRPRELMEDGVEAEVQACSVPDSPSVDANMKYHLDLNWTCNEDFWWLNAACAAYGDDWMDECLVVIEDDWNYVKTDFYDYLAISEVPVAKLMVGYDPWWELIYYKAYQFVYTWWSPDASVQNQKGRRVNLPYGSDMVGAIAIKIGNGNAVRANDRLQTFLTTVTLSEEFMDPIMNQVAAAYEEGYEGGRNASTFYQKLACDWLRSNEGTWSGWLPSANSCVQGQTYNATSQICEDCPIGTASALSADRVLYCAPCAAGTYAESPGMTACVGCAKGSYVDVQGKTVCELCPIGSFTNTTGMSECTACETGVAHPRTTDARGVTDSSQCKCAAGFYEGPERGACTPCPEGMTCEFGSAYDAFATWDGSSSSELIPMLQEGYFSLESNPVSVYLCEGSAGTAHCPGGAPQSCGRGRIGLVCARCPDGEAPMDDGSCVSCDAPATYFAIGLLPIGLLGMTLFLYVLANDPISSHVSTTLFFSLVLGIVITTVQAVALLDGLQIAWREQGDLFGSFTFLVGSPNGLRIECVLTGAAEAVFIARCMLPVLCVFSVLFIYFMSRLTALLSRSSKPFTRTTAQNTLGQTLHTVFIVIAVLVVQPLRCYEHPNGKHGMSSFPQVLCWETSEHTIMVTCGALVGIFFLVPFIVACIWAMYCAPTFKGSRLLRWRFLIYRFRPEKWWWGIVFLFRQSAFAFSSCIPAEMSQMQIVYFAVVALLYVTFTCTQWPWKTGLLNVLDVGSILMINTIIISASSFTEPATEFEKTFFVAFHFVLFALFSAFALAAIVALVYNMIRNKSVVGEFRLPCSISHQAPTIKEKWLEFIFMSSKLNPALIMETIETFNEYDLSILISCMSAFRSICDAFDFSPSMKMRLETTNHPRVDVPRLSKDLKEGVEEPVVAGWGHLPKFVDL